MFQRLKSLYFETAFRLKRIGLFVFGGLLLLSSVLMLLGGWMIHGATADWPETQGRLLKFDVEPLKNHSSHVRIDVAFRYTVDGNDYQGQYFSPLTRPGKMLRWVARRKQHQYQVGEVVSVIYDPGDPSVSYLEPADLFWDVSLIPVSIGALGTWLLFLFVKMKRRVVPAEVAAQQENRFEDLAKWRPILTSVVDRDHLLLNGFTAYSATGSLLAGWPQCRVALIATPNEFAVVPGPFTKRGIASSLLTLALEFSLSRFWLPAFHGTFFLIEIWRRYRNWRLIDQEHYSELLTKTDHVQLTPIDDAVVYGLDQRNNRFWYRLPGQRMDEFVRLHQWESGQADELIAYIDLMQKAGAGTEVDG